MKKNKYAPAFRLLKDHDVIRDRMLCRFDILVLQVLTKEPGTPEINKNTQQFHFTFSPETFTLSQLAKCFRSLAYKIQHMERKKKK